MTNETFLRVKTDARLRDQGWEIANTNAVRFEHVLGSRTVLIGGLQLSRLKIRHNVGCRNEDVLHLKKVDEDFFGA